MDPAQEPPQKSPGDPDSETPAGSTGPDIPASNLKTSSTTFGSNVEKVDFGQPTAAPLPPAQHRDGQTAQLYASERSEHPETVTEEQLKELTSKLDTANLQGLRVANFSFEPVSLPVSRVPSHDDDSERHTSGQQTPASADSFMLSARAHEHELHSPPLTPSRTPHLDSDRTSPSITVDAASGSSPHSAITPQDSTRDTPYSSAKNKPPTRQRASFDDVTQRPPTAPGVVDLSSLGNHRKGMFNIGPTTTSSSSGGTASIGGKSVPVSREPSPVRNNPASQFYTRPFTPSGDTRDPYAADKRQPQNKIEPRFVFSKLSRRKDASPTSSSISIAKNKDDKQRQSGFFVNHKENHKRDKERDGGSADDSLPHSRQGSMSDLRRFFKLGPSHHHRIKRAVSPAMSIRSSRNIASKSAIQIPFSDEHSLTSKYGKLGKVLGSGAGGSVRLMKRSEDSTVFAVKEFRVRHSHESEKEYVKKLTAEYCIGSSLHHGNIIETLDIIREKNKWYEVMEYAPYDLFAIVMTGRMTRAEIACCFLQILSGVTYLHSMGLAHRDLKLDNVVVSEYGIMKIIDFGSAHVFRYPFESGIVRATGIVGSDPYLAPEVYDERKYDPTAVDIWSLAIIFCCMTLRRFPWKIPRLTDNSYKLFASEPTPGHDPKNLSLALHKSHVDPPKAEAGATENKAEDKHDEASEAKRQNEREPDASDKDENAETAEKTEGGDFAKEETAEPSEKHDKEEPTAQDGNTETVTEHKPIEKPEKKEVVKGPWRILRLLPRESRHVIGGMLVIDPKERIKMAELLKDPWVANTVICRQVEPGRVICASSHTHVLEHPSPPMK